jgi:hypothetical protein
MFRGFILSIGLTLAAAAVSAADVNLKWDPVPQATGYVVYRTSTIVGQCDGSVAATWSTSGQDVGESTEVILAGVSDNELVLFRVSAYDANSEVVRAWSGAWYNGIWAPLPSPSGTSVK